MSSKNAASVQKHRAKMKAHGYHRLEVTIGRGMIDLAQDLAQRKGWPLWQVVEEAIEAFALRDQATTGNKK